MNAKKDPNSNIIQTALRIPKEVHKSLKIIAAENEKSLQDLYTEAIDHILKKYEKQSK